MDTPLHSLHQLTPQQRQALYEQAKRDAHALRRQAMRDFGQEVARALLRAFAPRATKGATNGAAACPR